MFLLNFLIGLRDKLNFFHFHLNISSFCHLKTLECWSAVISIYLAPFLHSGASHHLQTCSSLASSCSSQNCSAYDFPGLQCSTRGRKWEATVKSFYCLSSSPCCLPSTNFSVPQTSLLTVAHWLLLFNECKMGEEMVKFKAKKDSGKKNVDTSKSSLDVETRDI